jgi:hypothetical protein
MKQELQSAANLIVHLLRLNKNCHICEPQLKKFRNCIIEALYRRCRDNWFPDKPDKGIAYRTIRFYKMESWLKHAGEASKLKAEFLKEMLPNNLMIWINPGEVLYRFGDDNCICILYDHNNNTEAWNHTASINKPVKKTIKKNQINPLVVKENKKKDPLEEIKYRLNTKRSISIELLTAYLMS